MTYLINGNKAAAIAAIDSGIGIATSYPGTPATGILKHIIEQGNTNVQWSVNEKVAYEIALGCSYGGMRALCSMKHLGANLIMDSLTISAYTGIHGGLVLLVADDPNPTYSQTAIDTRNHAVAAKIPCLEPSCPQETYDIVRYSFSLSERIGLPVMVRITPEISYASSKIKRTAPTNRIKKKHVKGDYVCLPKKSNGMLKRLLLKQQEIEDIFEEVEFNTSCIETDNLGIIACGVTYPYVLEAKKEIGMKINILKISTTSPLPKKKIKKFLDVCKEVIVIEELDQIIENLTRTLNGKAVIFGKEDLGIQKYGEMNTGIVISAIKKTKLKKINIDSSPSTFCSGCPHRGSYYSLMAAVEGMDKLIIGDRGCYNLGANPPFNALDVCLCMGSSISVAEGLKIAEPEKKVIAIIGDSTFFHSGLLSFVNSVQHKRNLTVIILDNGCTAMTGQQPNPGTGKIAGGLPGTQLKIECIVKSMGISPVICNPFDVNLNKDILVRELNNETLSVIIFREPCALKKPAKKKYFVTDKCNGCGICISSLSCPAIGLSDGKAIITNACKGCGLCYLVCPGGAIREA
jgi:indolepyruvate ferredoxin oxidoreductase, alpha subunit